MFKECIEGIQFSRIVEVEDVVQLEHGVYCLSDVWSRTALKCLLVDDDEELCWASLVAYSQQVRLGPFLRWLPPLIFKESVHTGFMLQEY